MVEFTEDGLVLFVRSLVGRPRIGPTARRAHHRVGRLRALYLSPSAICGLATLWKLNLWSRGKGPYAKTV